jgi:hypothetical protein
MQRKQRPRIRKRIRKKRRKRRRRRKFPSTLEFLSKCPERHNSE